MRCGTRQGLQELVGVLALPAGRGEEDVEALRTAAAGEAAKLSDRLRRGGDAHIGHAAGALDLRTEREPDAFLLERHELTTLSLCQQQPDRVRPDVHDPDPHRHAS